MKERGYPTDDFEQRGADISVEHPELVGRGLPAPRPLRAWPDQPRRLSTGRGLTPTGTQRPRRGLTPTRTQRPRRRRTVPQAVFAELNPCRAPRSTLLDVAFADMAGSDPDVYRGAPSKLDNGEA
jgi:hypothetical protein